MRVKICGITNEDDAHLAVDSGAHALGFIFVESSPRYIAPSSAAEIIRTLPPFVVPVGVFVDSSREKVKRIAELTGIQAIQFHGDETPEDMRGYAIGTYKAFSVDANFDVARLQTYPGKVFLLDTYVDGLRGGTGRTFNWNVAVEARKFGKIILSGGLRPDTIADAIQAVHPFAVDVNSGVESYPGKKDKVKLRDLFMALRNTQEFVC